MNDISVPTEERIFRLLNELGVERAHFAACLSGDWGQFVIKHGPQVQSLTVIMPHLNNGIPQGLGAATFPSLVITGDQGKPADTARLLYNALTNAEMVELEDYSTPIWADTLADRKDEVASAMLEFLNAGDADNGLASVNLTSHEGVVAGIAYRIEGAGPPLVLMPLSLSPSQWDPMIPMLAERFCVIKLFGPNIGAAGLLEARVNSGYGDLVLQLLQHAELKKERTLIEIGCGTGALARKVAGKFGQENHITGTDINDYLLSEANFLAQQEGLAEVITFEKSDCTSLPYADSQFDVALCCTVLEEGDANRMASEIARVIKPDGHAVIMTRAIDTDWIVNVEVPAKLCAKLNALGSKTGGGVSVDGCADNSLYGRFSRTGIMPVLMGPLYAIYRDGERIDMVLERLTAMLKEDEQEIFRSAVHKARNEKTLFVGEPFHSLVGVKTDGIASADCTF